jgi:hypothetical protein
VSLPAGKSFSPARINPVPAIQPALLKQQAVLLADHFNDPPAYLRSLHYLLDFYSDRSRRPGQAGTPAPMISAYKVRPPVLSMILQELAPLAENDPSQGLALCDALWNEPYLEFRLLSAMLLGEIPPSPPDTILQRLKKWLVPDLEFFLIEALMEHSFNQVRKQHPQEIVQLIRDWLDQGDQFYKQLGLRALLPVINHPDFQNLPVFFRLIQPLVNHVPSGLRPDMLDVLGALAHRSPLETAFFLQQSLNLPKPDDVAWLVRQSLDEFPPEIRQTLRQAVKDATERKRIVS